METTLFPIQSLPPCAKNCGPLFDANGACVPPAKPKADASAYDSCFCKDSRLTAFSKGTSGVCDAACAGNADGLKSIQGWYTSFCDKAVGGAASTSTSTPKKGGGHGGGWLSTHYQWVIFLVIMIVGIAGIWIGACIWRKRYLQRRDRQYALDKRLAHVTESGRVVPNASQAASIHVPGARMFEPAPLSSAGVYGQPEKPAKVKAAKPKRKWRVTERT